MTTRLGIAACLVIGSVVLLTIGLRGRGHASRATPSMRPTNAEAERANRDRLRSLGYLN